MNADLRHKLMGADKALHELEELHGRLEKLRSELVSATKREEKELHSKYYL